MTVCVFGSINRDHVLRVAALPRRGETVPALTTRTGLGGKGANQAVAAVRSGAVTRMFGALGDDAAGAFLYTQLHGHGVDVSGLVVQPHTLSGAAYVTVEADGENHIVVATHANGAALPPDDAALHGCTVALAQLETPISSVEAFFDAAARAGARCILNAAPAVAEGHSLFAKADILIVNAVELASYLGVAGEVDDLACAREMLIRPGQCVIVTLGARGAALISHDVIIRSPPVWVDRVMDTTGAGDAFCGTVAARLAAGDDWGTALNAANAAAATCVQRHGAL